MPITVRRHMGKLLAGAAIAVTGTAVMIGVTLPGQAGAAGDGTAARGVAAGGTTGTAGDGSADAAGQGVQPGLKPARIEAAPAERAKGFGRDPLTDAELARVRALAAGPAAKSAVDSRGGQGPQWLTTDLAELRPEEAGKPGAPRRAQVTSYDYKTNALRTSLVNLDTGKVESTDVQRGVQPPIAREEAVQAVKLIIAAPQGEGLRKDYRDATGKALTGPEQLSLKNALIYRVDSENPGPRAVKECGRERCARLFLKVKNGPWIDVRSLVVNLSTRTVHRV
ncbi:Tat pathway signal sequence domain protein [Streptomyces sp. NPDC097619]|uniref:Tat pathway signal sequence domain protein n=1 Tax=Streptomyces sp. NPDC097619 TaxID=3157228 RepID=UPI0033313DFA